MKILTSLLFPALLQFAVTDIEQNCKTFKTGTFRLIDKELENEYLIERDEVTQIEKDLRNNTTSKFKVTWVSECEYELEILEGREEVMAFFKDKTLLIRILETYENGYKYEAQLKGTEIKLTHTVEKIM